ncbi:Histone-lysine N-methyltransferase [Fasciola gigantica]|uniref:[histone H4]-lysine(20) N-methyltransferase n=1 Tax=Fasciola gigantica TaxID=46835 RepID=A0A504YNK7_FASGI|nr:Histone-lysine N-methyltransferase [Fasciola gigantica]
MFIDSPNSPTDCAMASAKTQRPLDVLKQEPKPWDNSRPEFCSTPHTVSGHSLKLSYPESDKHLSDVEGSDSKTIPLHTPKLRQTLLNLSTYRGDEATVAMLGELNFNCTFQPDDKDKLVPDTSKSPQIKMGSDLSESVFTVGTRGKIQTVLASDMSLSDSHVTKEPQRRQKKTATDKKGQRGARTHSVESRSSIPQPVGRPKTRTKAVSLSPKKGSTVSSGIVTTGLVETDKKSKRQTQLTTYGIRRTARQFQKDQERQREANVLLCLRDKVEIGMKVIYTEEKGRGVVATRVFHEGEFVVEYAGELISEKLAKDRETEYKKDPEIGSFMFYFVHAGQRYCVDATKETPRLGRLINHSRLHPNCVVKVIPLDGVPRLVLFARQIINPGDEFLYDYGDRDKESLEAHPWLRT